jgi:tetratricopeptide (TPR) repeat protein
MGAVATLTRLLALVLGLPTLVLGALGLGLVYAPDLGAVSVGRALVGDALGLLSSVLGPSLAPEAVFELLAGPAQYVAAGLGVVLVGFALAPRRGAGGGESESSRGRRDAPPKLDRSSRRRADKQVRDLTKKGNVREAADLAFTADQLDKAVDLYQKAGDLVRAAEIRHDQNRFDDAAALYTQAGQHESAASIFAELEQWDRAAEAFERGGRKSMAGEMWEKAGQDAKAAQCFEDSGFARHAAQAWVRCQRWAKAAHCLEEVIAEEGAKVAGGSDLKKEKELRTLVLQCGKLWEQAGELDKAAVALERGNCHAQAAELALRLQRYAKAAELFQRIGDALKAADALQKLGETKAAAQLLGEYYRDHNDDQKAAEAFEQAGDFLSAGDLWRKQQEFARAADCYERNHDYGQAAEMFRAAGDPARAATAYEASHHYADAAACWGEAGDRKKQAELLVRADRLLEAGEILHADGATEEAIKILQRVEPTHCDHARASSILGGIFRAKGMYSLAVKKLRQAIGNAELSAENVEAFYTLAIVYDANRQFAEAVELYEKILASDFHYKDVEARLDAGRDKLRLSGTGSKDLSAGPAAAGGTATGGGGGRYQVVSELGRGGMGIVYKANDTVLDRVVAYKVLPDTLVENPVALKNFLREAKAAAQLNHPNIVTVYDCGEQEGRYYIAMEFVDGTTLKDIVKRKGAIAPGGALHVLAQMAEGLAYAHEKKIVHRDVKTANTMWTRDKKAKIMDFGLAKVMEEVRNHTTLVSGTPYYMSPEQTLGRNVDHRTDLYSLGVTLFELLTGRLPFMEGNIPYHHVHSPPPDPREFNPKIPELLANVVLRCMQKNPDTRYANARELLAEIRAARSLKAE